MRLRNPYGELVEFVRTHCDGFIVRRISDGRCELLTEEEFCELVYA